MPRVARENCVTPAEWWTTNRPLVAYRVIGPGVGQIQRTINERGALGRRVGEKHADLRIRRLTDRAGVLAGDPH